MRPFLTTFAIFCLFIEIYQFSFALDDFDALSERLQVDFMSNLYSDMISSSKTASSKNHTTVVTVKPIGHSICPTATDPFLEDVVLVDFKKSVFDNRNFTSVGKVAIYVYDKSRSRKESQESYRVSVIGTGSETGHSNFQLSASVAVGGKSVFLLPNETDSVCVYFPAFKKRNLGIFGVVWGNEDVVSGKHEKNVLGMINRRRRSAESGNETAIKPEDEILAQSLKRLEHPRFMLKERMPEMKNRGGKKSRKMKAGKRRRNLSKKRGGKRRQLKDWADEDFLPFGSTSEKRKKHMKRRNDGKKRRSVKNGKKKQRHHRKKQDHLSKIEEAKKEVENSMNILLNDPVTDETSTPATAEPTCEHFKLPIRLDELGWKRVIIAPEVVDISYCSGTCSSSDVSFSNSSFFSHSNFANLGIVTTQQSGHAFAIVQSCPWFQHS